MVLRWPLELPTAAIEMFRFLAVFKQEHVRAVCVCQGPQFTDLRARVARHVLGGSAARTSETAIKHACRKRTKHESN